jgi:hypothetical protein
LQGELGHSSSKPIKQRKMVSLLMHVHHRIQKVSQHECVHRCEGVELNKIKYLQDSICFRKDGKNDKKKLAFASGEMGKMTKNLTRFKPDNSEIQHVYTLILYHA